MAITAGDLLPTIKKLAASYLEEIGGTDSAQNSFIFIYLNNALRKLAHIAYNVETSDELNLSADGYVTFKKNNQDIANLYSPLRIYGPDGRTIPRRSSSEDYKGWWREAANTRIHIRGYTEKSQPLTAGNYTLDYIFYPTAVTQESSPVQFPDAGTMGLCYYCAALILESRPNAKDLVIHYFALANQHLSIAVQANIDARGKSSGGYAPTLNTVDQVFKG